MKEQAPIKRPRKLPVPEPSPQEILDKMREAVLEKVAKAGSAGMPIGKFGYKRVDARRMLDQLLTDLIAHGQIGRFQGIRSMVYCLPRFVPTLETVKIKINDFARNSAPLILTAAHLKRALGKGDLQYFALAMRELVIEKQLVKVYQFGRQKKRGTEGRDGFYLHAKGVEQLTAQILDSPGKTPPVNMEVLLQGYQKLVITNGFPDVEIFDLHRNLHAPLSEIKSLILSEYQAGKAVLSLGDWSLASEQTRSGAIELDGERYLRVRFQ